MEKRFLLAGLLAASALMAACSDDDSSIFQAVSYKQESEIKPAAYTGPRQIVLHGVASGEDGLQKTAIASGGTSVVFSEGDEISLFDGNRKNCELGSAVADGGKSADFTGTIEKEADSYIILYPYQAKAAILPENKISATLPATQVATPGSFDPAANLSVAIGKDKGIFALKNVGSLLKFTTYEQFKKIVVRSNNTAGEGEAPVCPKIAGNITIAIGSDGTPTAEASDIAESEIELVPASGETSIAAGTYYVALLSGEYSQGLTIDFYYNSTDAVSSGTYRRFQKKLDLPRSNEANFGELLTANGVYIDMVKVAGTEPSKPFTMGATDEQGADASDNETPVHQVTLSGYSIGRFEVTQRLWMAVMGNNPSSHKEDGNLDLPVERVYLNYEQSEETKNASVQVFLDKLNEIPSVSAFLKKHYGEKPSHEFRLPTEAEWEFAARGGTESAGYNNGKYFKYSGDDDIDKVAWHAGNSSSKSHTVGTKAPNELGIYDMSGNVFELCNDWYGDYSGAPQTNPTGSSDGSYRVGRGGCWYGNWGLCRVSCRYGSDPASRYEYLGFRLAL